MSDIVLELREKRQAQRISQTKLASMCGMNQQQISMYENGVKIPSIESVERIADVLGYRLSLTAGTKHQH